MPAEIGSSPSNSVGVGIFLDLGSIRLRLDDATFQDRTDQAQRRHSGMLQNLRACRFQLFSAVFLVEFRQACTVFEAYEKGGARSARDVDQIVSEVAALFAGGELSDEQKEGVMAALNRAYWDAKETNKKYTPKKYRK